MKIVKCDLCDNNIDDGNVLSIEVLDGEHPHNGSTMTKTIDVCVRCALPLDLKCNKEYSELRRKQ